MLLRRIANDSDDAFEAIVLHKIYALRRDYHDFLRARRGPAQMPDDFSASIVPVDDDQMVRDIFLHDRPPLKPREDGCEKICGQNPPNKGPQDSAHKQYSQPSN